MRILIITAVFPPEPVVSAKISKQLAIGFVEKGWGVTVLTPKPSRPKGFDFSPIEKHGFVEYFNRTLPGVKVLHLNSFTSAGPGLIRRLRENITFGRRAANYIHRNNGGYDHIYINSWPLFSQYLIAKAAHKLDIPYIIHIQDIYPESLTNKLPTALRSFGNKMLMPIERFHLTHAKKIIVISESMKDYFIRCRNIEEEKLSVIYNWQDESEFSNNRKEDATDKFNFTYLGNIGPVAGVETLINAFGAANLSNCCLVIAGGGANREKCIKAASSFRLADIRIIDVPENEAGKIQSDADVLLLPMIKGGALSSIPSKLPAYMLSKKPILATLDSESDTARAIISADCGWVGDAEDVTWLAAKMRTTYLIQKEELIRLGTNGYNYCIKKFSKKVNLKKLLDLFST